MPKKTIHVFLLATSQWNQGSTTQIAMAASSMAAYQIGVASQQPDTVVDFVAMDCRAAKDPLAELHSMVLAAYKTGMDDFHEHQNQHEYKMLCLTDDQEAVVNTARITAGASVLSTDYWQFTHKGLALGVGPVFYWELRA